MSEQAIDLPAELHTACQQHRDITGGWARAAIFGISDGLVSNASLVLGMEGAHPAVAAIRLAGMAGLLGGALSMAAGELVSMRAQAELLQHELEVERAEIERAPEHEREELALIYRRRGLTPAMADVIATEMMATPELALEAHAREELGIDPHSLGSPLGAAVASFCSFALGALVPVLAVFVAAGAGAALLAAVLSGGVAAVVGALLGRFSGRPVWRASLRQLAVCATAAGVTYAIGTAVGQIKGL